MVPKKDRTDIVAYAVVTTIFAVLLASLITIFTQSPWHLLAAFILAIGAVAVYFFQIPPGEVATIFHRVIALYWLAALLFCVLQSPEWTSPLFAIMFLVCGVALSFLQVAELAWRNFHVMKEIEFVGEGMQQKRGWAPLISHVTDIHLTTSEDNARIELGKPKLGGHKQLKVWLNLVCKLNVPYLVVTGDMTDSGDVEEWKRAQEIVESLRPIDSWFILAPGNHDLSEAYGESTKGKARRYFENQARWCTELVASNGMMLSKVFEQALNEITPDINTFAEKLKNDFIFMTNVPFFDERQRQQWFHPTVFNKRLQIAETRNWHEEAREELIEEWFDKRQKELFPLRLEDRGRGVLTLVLNSVSSLPSLGESALGTLGESQINRIKEILLGLQEDWCRVVIIATHHAPFRHPGEWTLLPTECADFKAIFARLWDWALLAQDVREARKFIDMLSTIADKHQTVDFFLFCGHRHSSCAARAGRMLVIEGACLADPNATTWLIYKRHNAGVDVYAEAIK